MSLDLLKRFNFDWQVMEVIIRGRSAIDSAQGLKLTTTDDVERFLHCYGYDVENPIEKAELFGNFHEAISFIRRYFLKPENPEGINLEIPRKILEITDITQLFLMAGEFGRPTIKQSSINSLWACSVIKIMHTIAHMDKDYGASYFSDIQKQILDRFYRFIHSEEGNVFLGKDMRDEERIPLVAFESKPKKSRDSVLLKLLHKPENVAEDIFDRVGIRFITHNKLDAIRVVKFLKDRYVVMPGNIKPSRSRNTLFDTDAFQKELETAMTLLETEKVSLESIEEKLLNVLDASAESEDKENPHTSRHYRSIQFTGRHLIKFKNPVYEELRQLKKIVKSTTCPEEVVRIAEAIDTINIQRETRFFYPFEVQVVDEKSHGENLAGKSSHGNYKKGQIVTAMKRVMGPLMNLHTASDEENKN